MWSPPVRAASSDTESGALRAAEDAFCVVDFHLRLGQPVLADGHLHGAQVDFNGSSSSAVGDELKDSMQAGAEGGTSVVLLPRNPDLSTEMVRSKRCCGDLGEGHARESAGGKA